MTNVMDILANYFHFQGFKHYCLDGSMKPEEHATLLTQFNDPNMDTHLFMLSTHAGGLGLNLQTAVGRIIVWYPACLYSQVLMPAAIQQFSIPIQCFFDQKSCLWAALIYPLPIFHFPNPFQTLTQLCHRIEPVFTITPELHSTLYLFWKPRYGSCRFFVYAFFLSNPFESGHAL